MVWLLTKRTDDLQVVGCRLSGVRTYNNATITLSGMGTSIQGNGTKGRSDYFGLDACGGVVRIIKKRFAWRPGLGHGATSSIQLVAPLTKEQISINNCGGRNWGGGGTIEQIHQVMQAAAAGQESERC